MIKQKTIDRISSKEFMSFVKNETIRKKVSEFIVKGYTQRIDQRYSQADYANLIGLDLNMIKKIELGTCNNLTKIAIYYNGIN